MDALPLANWRSKILKPGEKKRCSKCKEEKPIEEFRKLPQSSDGRTPQCIPCEKKVADARRERKKEDKIYQQWP